MALLCVLVAGLQAVTHLMVHSDLCKDVLLTVSDPDTNQLLEFDTCSKDTLAYNMTFATIALWMFAGIILGTCGPLTSNAQEKEDAADEENPASTAQ
uniref:Uncharacterized protein n=1 Tax=Entomoneis paludosa TaxID=265537 RepID=A0A7S3DXP9_9STRA